MVYFSIVNIILDFINMVVILKCRKCRYELVRETASQYIVISSHGESLESQAKETICSNIDQDSLCFLEETGTSWISEVIEKVSYLLINCACLLFLWLDVLR